MILSLFRTNQIFTAILLIFYIAVLHFAPYWIDDNWEPEAYGFLAKGLYDLIGFKGLYAGILAALLIFIQAIIIIRIDFGNKLSKEATLFPGVFLILASSISVPLLHLSPQYFSNIFLLLAINELLATYRNPKSSVLIFNTGFFIGLASLFTPAYLIFLILIFAGLNLLRGFNFNERIMTIVGVGVVYFLTGTGYFWYGELDSFFHIQFGSAFSFLDFWAGNFFTYIHLSLIGILVLIILFYRGQITFRQTVQAQRKIDIFYWGLLFCLPVVLFQSKIQESSVIVLMPFIGLFLGMLFSTLRRNVAELLHFLLFILALFLQYRPFFLP